LVWIWRGERERERMGEKVELIKNEKGSNSNQIRRIKIENGLEIF
jgi:hypothetical protein